MDVAIGLGRRASSVATATLVRMLGDTEHLVRYHALKSLAAVGDASALAAIREHEPDSQHERELAEQAIGSIEERAGR
jgi:HEAT repeat protein